MQFETEEVHQKLIQNISFVSEEIQEIDSKTTTEDIVNDMNDDSSEEGEGEEDEEEVMKLCDIEELIKCK